MTRQEFMDNLEKLLWDTAENERNEALQYYNDYFDDAGEENEEAVLRKLGSPVEVAKKIKAGCSENTSEYSEQGYEDTRFKDAMEMIVEEEKLNWQTYDRQEENFAKEEAATGKFREKKPSESKVKLLVIILLCILAAPIVLPLGIGFLATVFSILIAVVAVIFGFGIAGVAVLVSGLIILGIGIGKMFLFPAIGLSLMGVGCILFSVGLLITLALIWCGIKCIPWLIRGVVNLISLPFRKAGAYT